MQRALRTAQLARFEDLQVTDLLEEFDYGMYEGLTTQQIHEKNSTWELFKDGCPGGESPDEVYTRARRFIDLAIQHKGTRALAFAHGHIIRAIAVAWINASITLATNLQLDVAALNIVRDGDHGRVIALWNET
jgi:probable phosphoglycerate mutase